MEERQKPLHEIRLGRVRATVWENRGEKGIYRKTTFSKLYKGKDNKWQDTGSFDKEDLLLLAEVARQTAYVLYREKPEEEGGEGP
jgi:hypothetical protein